MTSVGVMASAALTGELLEPFNDFTTNGWVQTGTSTIVSGRTGTALQITNNSTAHVDWNIPSGSQADTATVGFAWRRTDGVTTQRTMVMLYSDTGTLQHNQLIFFPATSTLAVTRGATNIATATSVTLTTNTWYYIELQIRLHDSAGTAIVRRNGVELINTGSLDTKNTGTKTVYDQLRIQLGAAGSTCHWDDLYLSMGSTAAFKGDIALT